QGVTSYMKIQHLVASKHRYINAHAWSAAITTAASLHCSMASSNSLVFELKPIPGPVQFDIVEEPIMQEEGWVSMGDAPGLGINIMEKKLQAYAVVNNSASV